MYAKIRYHKVTRLNQLKHSPSKRSVTADKFTTKQMNLPHVKITEKNQNR